MITETIYTVTANKFNPANNPVTEELKFETNEEKQAYEILNMFWNDGHTECQITKKESSNA